MISLDWKERMLHDCDDFFERKLPKGDYDFDIIYNAYPGRHDNKIPRDVVVFVAQTLASKMMKNHKDYLPFCEYIWNRKGLNGKIVFSCVISKFLKKDYLYYFEYTKKYLFTLTDLGEINLLIDKIFYPIFKKNPTIHIDTLLTWIREANEKISQQTIKLILKIGKNDSVFLKKFMTKLEGKWLGANPDFVKVNGFFLKNLAKINYESYLQFYKNYKNSREPIFVEILTAGLTGYEDFIYEIYENWSKSGNARLKKAALTGFKYLNRKKN